jgi:hypothetical protein
MDKLSGLLFTLLTFTGIAVLVLVVGVFAARRWFRGGRDSGGRDSGPIFTLQDLRQMRDAGEITEQEYVTLRTRLVGPLADPLRRAKPADEPDLPPREGD